MLLLAATGVQAHQLVVAASTLPCRATWCPPCWPTAPTACCASSQLCCWPTQRGWRPQRQSMQPRVWRNPSRSSSPCWQHVQRCCAPALCPLTACARTVQVSSVRAPQQPCWRLVPRCASLPWGDHVHVYVCPATVQQLIAERRAVYLRTMQSNECADCVVLRCFAAAVLRRCLPGSSIPPSQPRCQPSLPSNGRIHGA